MNPENSYFFLKDTLRIPPEPPPPHKPTSKSIKLFQAKVVAPLVARTAKQPQTRNADWHNGSPAVRCVDDAGN
jgi:hypothetical protein